MFEQAARDRVNVTNKTRHSGSFRGVASLKSGTSFDEYGFSEPPTGEDNRKIAFNPAGEQEMEGRLAPQMVGFKALLFLYKLVSSMPLVILIRECGGKLCDIMSSVKSISRQVPAIFAGVMLVFIILLMWLGWILIEQDSDLVNQRKRDAVEAFVTEASNTFRTHIAEEQRQLRQFFAELPANSDISTPLTGLAGKVVIVFDQDRIHVSPESALRYLPTEIVLQTRDQRLIEADRLEFGQKELGSVSVVLIGLSDHANPQTRAGSLARLARIRGKQNREEDALALYLQLSQIQGASVGGVPATLLDLFGRSSVLENSSSDDLLVEEATCLGHILQRGGHQIDKATYQFYTEAVIRWIAPAKSDSETELTRSLRAPHVPSEAANLLNQIWEGWQGGRESSEGVRSATIDGAPVVLSWVGSGDRFVGEIGDSTIIQNQWFTALGDEYEATGIGSTVSDESGNRLYSAGIPFGNIQIARTIASAGQAWTITSFETALYEVESQNQTRWRILLGSLFIVIGIVASSTYFLSRALTREVAVAQLQSDFVSTVSHEFRTPLTSMRQITEMLSSGRVPAEREKDYYADLDKESHRLSRLVEGLLKFGHMEAGSFPYSFEPTSLGDVVRETTAEFQNEASLTDTHLRLSIEANPICDIDRDTFQLALWNLLDNAFKYSAGQPKIEVQLTMQDSEVSIAVSDTGSGISTKDQARVFDKFVRGSDLALTGVKGTGLGLALVKRIVEEHGGRIVLESEPGAGSTFTLILSKQKDV